MRNEPERTAVERHRGVAEKFPLTPPPPRPRRLCCAFLALALALVPAGCGLFVEDGPWNLELGVGTVGEQEPGDVLVFFPDEQSLNRAAELRVWAFDARDASCSDLTSLVTGPDDLADLARLIVQLPYRRVSSFERVPFVQAAFFAEALDSTGIVLLRGCNTGLVHPGRRIEVGMNCVCQPVPGTCAAWPEIPANGVDDDCDGMTDECEDAADCEDNNGCTNDLCIDSECQHTDFPDGLECSDKDVCTSGDTCQAGTCSGLRKDCSEFDGSCVTGVCNPESGACEQKPKTDGSGCDDGLWCTAGDTCREGTCSGQSRDCSDADECTRDTCGEQADTCVHELLPRPGMEGPEGDPTCSNGVDDDCDGQTDGEDPNCHPCISDDDCDDGNECTRDTCDNGSDKCSNEPLADGALCTDDGVFCNGLEHCMSGACTNSGNPCPGADGDMDCSESCDEASDSCTALDLDDAACDDGQWCTVADACSSGTCGGIARDCSDGIDCTLDDCDESQDACTHSLQPDPGAEGPVDDPTCSNGIDDDCDGYADALDSDCGGSQQCSLGNGCFLNEVNYTVGDATHLDLVPKRIALGQFDNDGLVDIATANIVGDSLTILKGQSGGVFSDSPTIIPVGDGPNGIVAADLNGDGIDDLACTNMNAGTVGILLSKGSGGFFDPVYSYTGSSADHSEKPNAIIATDFDGNGIIDLAVTNANNDEIGIMLGLGGGAFGDVSNYSVGQWPSDLLAADFNTDGVTDLAVADYVSDEVSILLGGNDGGSWDHTFQPATCPIIGGPYTLAAGDFNGDGNLDLAVAAKRNISGHHDVNILLGGPDGGFTAGGSFDPQYGHDFPTAIVSAYLDSDCFLDLAVVGAPSGGGRVRVYPGDGQGGFTGNPYMILPDGIFDIDVWDINGDGINDLLTSIQDSDKVSVSIGEHK